MITRPLLMGLMMLFVLTGCQTWAELKPQTHRFDQSFYATFDRAWSYVTISDIFVMTIGGPQLQQMIINSAIEDGDYIYMPANSASTQETIQYKDGMELIEFVEAYGAGIQLTGYKQYKPNQFEKIIVDGKTGVSINFTMTSQNGLDYEGLLIVFDGKEKKHLFSYFGTKLYHFEKNRDDFLRVIESIQWIEPEEA